MDFRYSTNEDCHTASGLVVVIDVIRAFTTAAAAFRAGAATITLVSGVEEALALKAARPGSLAMGEVGGLPPPGFDLGNSPAEVAAWDLQGRHLVQRTGAGTQGAVRSVLAESLFAASFVVAGATARAIQAARPPAVTFVVTGRDPQGEDRACGEYLEALLEGGAPDPAPYLERVRQAAELRYMPLDRFPTLPADLAYCTDLDACPFAMPITREEGRLVMRARVPGA